MRVNFNAFIEELDGRRIDAIDFSITIDLPSRVNKGDSVETLIGNYLHERGKKPPINDMFDDGWFVSNVSWIYKNGDAFLYVWIEPEKEYNRRYEKAAKE